MTKLYFIREECKNPYKAYSAFVRHYLPKPYNNKYLTPRELDVLKLCKNHSNKEIGNLLNLSPRSVEYYIAKIRYKFRCRSKIQLVVLVEQYKVLQFIQAQQTEQSL